MKQLLILRLHVLQVYIAVFDSTTLDELARSALMSGHKDEAGQALKKQLVLVNQLWMTLQWCRNLLQ